MNGIHGCNSFYFYIKPQLYALFGFVFMVVIHSISTSNHNNCPIVNASLVVVIHSISTSNHNKQDYGDAVGAL